MDDLDLAAITLARLLALDSVEQAGSGHPGTAMSLAPVAHLLFQRHLRHNPADPAWPGRDRFVLSCGHASILLYTQLFLTGYGLELEDLKHFRTLGSRTPGHPEYGHTPGIETTTGPLGQGLATAVGMAMALKHERGRYDPDAPVGESPFDSTVWVLCSDGDLQEGLSYEAGAIAGRHKLDNIVVIYDDNDIQIEGDTSLTSSEDVTARFEAQGWHVQNVPIAASGDVSTGLIDAAMTTAAAHHGHPSLIIIKSLIAWPAPHARNTAGAHGAPLGEQEAAATRTELGSFSPPFTVDPEVLERTRQARTRGAELQAAWTKLDAAWAAHHEDAASERLRAREGRLPQNLREYLPVFEPGSKLTTRDASGKVLQALASVMSELWGGSADLAEPNRTALIDGGSFLPEEGPGSGRTGRNVHWGVREGAMASAMNGISLVRGNRFFAGTFLVFSDYQRPAIRLASLMQLPVTYIWTHDSVALGADGPTHQPIEHLASLRAIPGLSVVRPADAAETAAAWLEILRRAQPAGLILARQPIETLDTDVDIVFSGVARGAYVVREVRRPAAVIIATGSEVSLALEAAETLAFEGVEVRVVSMPCREWFEEQPADYRETLLPGHLRARVVVEAQTSFGWADISGPFGEIVSIDEFGLSASADDALRAKGMTPERVAAAVYRAIGHEAPH